MTLGQRLLAALIVLAMMFAFSAIVWVVAPPSHDRAVVICDPRGR
jgi:hypothetical protein